MVDLIHQAESLLLAPAELTHNQCQAVLQGALARGGDCADLYLQSLVEEEWYLEDGLVKDASYSVESGFGLRVIHGETVGFAYADNIVITSLEQAARSVRGLAHSAVVPIHGLAPTLEVPPIYAALNPMQALSDADKVALLQQIDAQARQSDPRITQVMSRLNAVYEVVLMMDSDGLLVADIRPLVYLNVSVLAKQGDRIEQGHAGGGGRFDLQQFQQGSVVQDFVAKAVRQALLNLDARPVPAGVMPVVLGPGWPAVLLHEAVGHGLEADFIRKGSSAFCGRMGEQVASKHCTIVDDATINNGRGSLTVDDEGTPGEYTPLIEQGRLVNYMCDKHNAKLMGIPSTGNGRRESYACMPLPRMTNTYMLPGDCDPAEIIASVDRGLYAVDFAGGQVDITSGKFVFSMNEAYLIEDGKIVHPVKGATLVGNGPQVLTQISMVGNDWQLDQGIGSCGKDGQTVPVAVGQPTLRIDELTVGGTQVKSQ